jgi:transketolase
MNNSSQLFSQKISIHALHMTSLGGSSHIGSALSISDIIAVLYSEVLNVDPKNPKWPQRDRFILSKGHAGAIVYAALAERGFFDVETLKSHYQNGSIFSGHVSHKGIPGVEVSTGSLGHGLSIGVGIAKAAKIDNASYKTYVVLSDGECDEGSNWEAILFASHHQLDNLIAIVDYNKLQSLKSTHDTLNLEPFRQKWESFGWNVMEVDGHNHTELKHAFSSTVAKKPLCILAHTTKGKGVSFMENNVLWHYRTARGDEFDKALVELEAGR